MELNDIMHTPNTPRTIAATVHNAELSDWGAGDSPYCYREQMEQLELDYNKIKRDYQTLYLIALGAGFTMQQIDHICQSQQPSSL